MSVARNSAVLRLRDGRFQITYNNPVGSRTIARELRYPTIQLKKNSIRVGCISVSKVAAKELFKRMRTKEIGFLQGEASV